MNDAIQSGIHKIPANSSRHPTEINPSRNDSRLQMFRRKVLEGESELGVWNFYTCPKASTRGLGVYLL